MKYLPTLAMITALLCGGCEYWHKTGQVVGLEKKPLTNQVEVQDKLKSMVPGGWVVESGDNCLMVRRVEKVCFTDLPNTTPTATPTTAPTTAPTAPTTATNLSEERLVAHWETYQIILRFEPVISKQEYLARQANFPDRPLPDFYTDSHCIYLAVSRWPYEVYASTPVGKECEGVLDQIISLFDSYDPAIKNRSRLAGKWGR